MATALRSPTFRTTAIVGLACLAACQGGGGGGSGADAAPVAVADAPPQTPDSDAGTAITCADFNPDKNVYWGDLHTHTALSADAYGWGNRNFPHDAYRFASDPTSTTPIAAGAPTPGPRVSIDRALDFDAVTDHSEWLGTTWGCGETPDGTPFDPASPYFGSPACQAYRGTLGKGVDAIIAAAIAVIHFECNGNGEGDPSCRAFTRSAWQVELQAAHDAYQPCKFTSLVAYEWTHAVNGATLHQNVIFGSESVPEIPFDSAEYKEPSELWGALERSCVESAGCSVLTIPHNPNLSQGMAFQIPAGVDALRQMNRYQRLAEIHQHKGNSECYGGPNPPDPRARSSTCPRPRRPSRRTRRTSCDTRSPAASPSTPPRRPTRARGSIRCSSASSAPPTTTTGSPATCARTAGRGTWA